MDTKKKELVGEFKNGGREYQPQGSPVRVNVHDFPDKELGKAIPYGIYDVAANTGWVSVGADHDTAAFAVETLRRWWNTVGRHRYPHADRLLICADGGGSNGYRVRAWKIELAALAAETGLTITVCHLPPGTSKWNKIEHRLFSQITLNWRGRPLTSHQIIVDLIGATTTTTGLTVRADLDTGTYPTGIKYTKKQVDALRSPATTSTARAVQRGCPTTSLPGSMRVRRHNISGYGGDGTRDADDATDVFKRCCPGHRDMFRSPPLPRRIIALPLSPPGVRQAAISWLARQQDPAFVSRRRRVSNAKSTADVSDCTRCP